MIPNFETNPVKISKMGNMWKEHRELTWINSKYPKIIQWLSTRSSSSLPQKNGNRQAYTDREIGRQTRRPHDSPIFSHDLVGLFVPPVGLARCSVRYLLAAAKTVVKGWLV